MTGKASFFFPIAAGCGIIFKKLKRNKYFLISLNIFFINRTNSYPEFAWYSGNLSSIQVSE